MGVKDSNVGEPVLSCALTWAATRSASSLVVATFERWGLPSSR